jgi:hypothetical protein
VREILREQNRIYNCGLALSPEPMEGMLGDLLETGFRFSLPPSILRPMPLPGAMANEVTVAGRQVAVSVVPRPPLIVDDRLWLRASIEPSALDDSVLRIQPRPEGSR